MSRLYVTGDLHQSIDICKLATHRFSLQKELDKSDIPLLELSYKEINSLTINDLKERIENLWQKK